MSLYWYRRLRVIGTVIHEISHALTVKLCGGHIDEIDITSHVSHRGQYNLGHQMAISYAPLIINTALAALLANWAVNLSPSGLPQMVTNLTGGLISIAISTFVMQIFILGVAFPIAAAALPSYRDARNPYSTFRRQINHLTLIQIFIFPIAVIILALGVIPLIFAYIRSQNPLFHIVSEVAFGTGLLLQATGLFIIVDPAAALDSFLTLL
jgi:hypothetical protein